MDAVKAFLQFLTDLFAALADFLGKTGIFGDLVNGIGNITEIVDDAGNDTGDDAEG